MTRIRDHRTVLHRARVATSLAFLAFGTALGAWTSRIPAIKQRLDLGDGQLAVGLLAFAAGAITGMQVVGRLLDRHGSRTVLVPMVFVEGLFLILPAMAGDVVTLAVALYAFGAVHGTLNIAMNANAVDVERAADRPLMSSFHAIYSIGGFVGAAAGGLSAHAGFAASTTFLTVGAAVGAAALWTARWALPAADVSSVTRDRSETGDDRPQRSAATSAGVPFLGILVFCCLVGEGAAADWSSVYLRDTLGSGAGFAAAAYAAFSIMMVAGRLVGDRLTARVGPVALVRGCGAVAAVGLGAALLVGHPLAGIVGFGCLGAGLSCIAPQVFSAAGSRDPTHAGRAIARVASIGYLGFLTGPLLIGAVAELTGLAWALIIPVVLALFVTLTAAALRPRPAGAGPPGEARPRSPSE
ncbi:putative MFS family arabinose efflux permease [Streptomyces achromogenes]|uniref:MFS family arabinose efflux permease n=1 Tax=Streptomyces achromogenes TaxID=67255 RepID=A0ABU0PS29_STRAH|nr:MFS transporter [Streptomyces achromogenes]MDQ0681188.1 putative MFS family arabinose efflux permease [Streptomyces achromogenes]